MFDQALIDMVMRRLNVDAAAMVIGFLMLLFGAKMIFKGIKDDGLIDLKGPFISGKVKSGFVGILLVFCSVIVVVVCLSVPKRTHKIIFERGNSRVEWAGSISTIQELNLIKSLIEQPAQHRENASSEPAAEPDRDKAPVR